MIQKFRKPKRLREMVAPDSPLARGLASARDRRPTPEDARAIEDGLFAALGAGAVATTAAGSLPHGTSAVASSATTSAFTSLALKATLVLAFGAGGSVLGVKLLRPQRSAPTSAAPAARAPIAIMPEAAPVITAGPAISAGPPRTARPRAMARRPPEAPAAAPLQAELQLIERARAALVADPTRALQLCEAHTRAHPTGVLAEERDAIAITALLALDRPSEARAALESFRRRYPSSPQSARLGERLRAAPGDR